MTSEVVGTNLEKKARLFATLKYVAVTNALGNLETSRLGKGKCAGPVKSAS